MLEETDRPIVILDCHDKASFWQALHSLGTDHKTLFALAELEHLKPQHQEKKEQKSIGHAHELCRALATGKHKLDESRDPKDLIRRIKGAYKIKLPAFDAFHQIGIATMTRVKLNEENPRTLPSYAGLAGKWLEGIQNLWGKAVGIDYNSEERQKRRRIKSAMTALKLEYHRKIKSLGLSVVRGDITPEKYDEQKRVLDAEYADNKALIFNDVDAYHQEMDQNADKYNKQFEGLAGEDSIFSLNEWGKVDLNIRDGYHFLRDNECLFEFDTTLADDQQFRVFVLARQDGQEIEMEFFYQSVENKVVLEVDSEVGRVKLDDEMRMRSWNIFDPSDGSRLSSGSMQAQSFYTKDKTPKVTGYLGHVMDISARMNDPDYPIINVSPTGRKVQVGKGPHFPFFRYELVEIPLERARIKTIVPSGSKGKGEELASSRVFHSVVRHARTYGRGTDDENTIIIEPYFRGDINKGVKASNEVVVAEPTQ